MRRLLLLTPLLLVGVAFTAVRSPSAHTAPGAVAVTPLLDRTVRVGGTARHYLLGRPASAGSRAPLVVGLHGAGGTGAAIAADAGLDRMAAQHGFVTAYPDGLHGTWNAGGCCLESVAEHVPDVQLVAAIIGDLVRAGTVDRGRVYVVGFSNGGMLASRVACELDVRGIGVVGGALVSPCPRSSVSKVMLVHGTADRMVPMAGYRGVLANGQTLVYPPLRDTAATWERLLGCRGEDSTDHDGVRRSVGRDCPGEARVELVVIEGMGHAWPGNRALPTADDRGYDVSAALVRFFGLDLRTGGATRRG